MNMVWFLGIAGVGMLLIAVVVSRRSRAAAILPGLVGAVLLFIVANFVAADRWLFPDAYDNPEALARLQDANLRNDWPAPASNDCPQWRGPFRDGSAAVPRIARDWTVHPPQQKWRIEASGGDSSPIVAAGRVYLHERHAEGEQIRCVDAETGIGIWSDVISVDYRPIKKPIQGPRATPAIHEGKLYLITARGQLIAYDTTTAKRLWERDLLKEHNASLPPSGMAGSPLIEGDMVIVQPGGLLGTVSAYDRITGEARWHALTEPTGDASPLAVTMHGMRQILVFAGRGMHSVDASNGRSIWSFPWVTDQEANNAMPIIAGNYVFVSSGYGRGCTLVEIMPHEKKIVRPERVYERRGSLLLTRDSSGILHQDHIYAFDTPRGDLCCINLRAPTSPVWSGDDTLYGRMIRINNDLLIQTATGDVVLVEATPEAFRVRARMNKVLVADGCRATPAAVGRFIYLRDHTQLICLDAGE